MGHLVDPKAPKMNALKKRFMFQDQCRHQPGSGYQKDKAYCTAGVHEGALRRKL